MTLLSRIGLALGAFLIVAGTVYGLVGNEYEGLTEMLTVAGGALVVGVYLTRAVQRGRAAVATQEAGASDSEPHVAPTIWPLVFALSMIGLVLGAVGFPWALGAGVTILVVALIGWSLDVRRQWPHPDRGAAAESAHGAAQRQTGP
jgi:Cytochrome c oxidase subunit IV